MKDKIKKLLSGSWDVILAALAMMGAAFYLGRTGWPFRKFKPQPYNPGEPRHFNNISEFVNWYQGRFPPGFWTLEGVADCDDRADYVRRQALQDGFVLSDALTRDGMYYGVRVTSTMGGHAGILARCGNEFWYLDPNNETFSKVVNID